MIIANLQLNSNEDESLYQTGHCGGTCFSRYAKELLNDSQNEFWIYGSEKNFRNLRADERTDRCITLTDSQIGNIKDGSPIGAIITNANRWDIIVHNQEGWAANAFGLKAKQVCWFTFVNQTVHPNNDALMLYSEDQKARSSRAIPVFKVKIGKRPPSVELYNSFKKEDFVFVCTRHDEAMDTNVVIDICNKHNIKILVAGPVLGDYKLNRNNINSFYLGKISEEQKIDLCGRAKLYSCVQGWDTIFSLSCIEALGCGTPVIARDRGCFSQLIGPANGFFFTDEKSFLDAWSQSATIKPIDCRMTALEYSDVEMVASFHRVFSHILKNGH